MRPRAGICARRKVGRRSNGSSQSSAPMNCEVRPRCCMHPSSVSPTLRARWSRSSTWPRWPIGAPVHPLRFRGNIYVSGWAAWREFDFVGQEITVGKRARLRVIKRIMRCAATNVDPDTGMRDLSIPDALMRCFGHADCGVYAEVVEPGEIAVGDELTN